MEYLVTKINIKDDYVKISVETSITISNFLIRLNDYLDLNIKLNSYLDDTLFDKLSDLHKLCYAYKKCLNKLTHKDYSVKEIEELLKSLEVEPKYLIEEFKLAGLLNDEELVKNNFEVGQINKVGKRKIFYDLKKRKVDERLIEKYFKKVDDNIEKENGIWLAQKHFESLKNISYKNALNKVREKLVNSGYADNVDEIMHQATFKKDEENEYNNLTKAYQKALRLYQNKYTKLKLKQHIFNHLYAKGYRSEEINKLLEELNNENN